MANLSTRLREMPYPDLVSAAEHVAAMQDTPGWALLCGLIAGERDRLVAQMTNPSLPTYEKLANITGELRGLDAALDVADKVLKVAAERGTELDALATASQKEN